ncbi:uncharacterized protein [Struthio camelus]|uniref:uncharacterized protein n=1 Tax=Struthio camelus TaxID=8801 RepID=UPI003603B45D
MMIYGVNQHHSRTTDTFPAQGYTGLSRQLKEDWAKGQLCILQSVYRFEICFGHLQHTVWQILGLCLVAENAKKECKINSTHGCRSTLICVCLGEEYCVQLPFPGCCTVLITALPLQILFENLICSITDNKGITWCMPCIFCRLLLVFPTEPASQKGVEYTNTDLTENYGHSGRGNIFIWASGNGGLANDCSGVDGYVNSIYTGAKDANIYLCPTASGLQELLSISGHLDDPARKECGGFYPEKDLQCEARFGFGLLDAGRLMKEALTGQMLVS